METEQTAERLLALLLRGGARHAFALAGKESRYCVRSGPDGVREISSGETLRARVRVQSERACFEKEYALNSGESVEQAAADALAELRGAPEDPDDAVFCVPETRRAQDVRGSRDPAAMQACLARLKQDAGDSGAELTRGSVCYRVREQALRADCGSSCSYRDDGYELSACAVLRRNGQTIDPFRAHAAFRRLADAPRLPEHRLLAEYAPLLFAPARPEKRFSGSWLVAPEALYNPLMDFLFSQLWEGSVLSGPTLWSGRLGQRVAAPGLTLRFDPQGERMALGERITQDGLWSKPFTLVEDGVLESFIAGRKAARLLGVPAPGNTSDSLVLAPGTAPLAELLAGIGRGVLTFSFAGSCRPDGSFSGICKNSFEIERGRVVRALNDVGASGSWPALLSEGGFRLSAETSADGESALPWACFEGVDFA